MSRSSGHASAEKQELIFLKKYFPQRQGREGSGLGRADGCGGRTHLIFGSSKASTDAG
jgi:hypothetical protein